MINYKNLFLIFSLTFVACAAQKPSPAIVVRENPVPGTVTKPWVAPMRDTVQVPGQIDPTNTYYRLPHKTVVEVRPEHTEKVILDEDSKGEKK
jgi:hypothetical protein